MAGKEVGVDQDQAGRNFHLILNLKYIYIYFYFLGSWTLASSLLHSATFFFPY